MRTTRLLMSTLAATMLMSTSALATDDLVHVDHQRPMLPLDNAETLCELRATDTTAAYRQRASAYGLTLQELRQLEQQYTCQDGQQLGNIESTWQS